MNTWNEVKYEVEGDDRKQMVQIIEQLIGAKAGQATLCIPPGAGKIARKGYGFPA